MKRAIATNVNFAVNSETVEPEPEPLVEPDTLVTKKYSDSARSEPLIIIDTKEADSKKLDELDSKDIYSFSILKDKAATKVYGEKGKNGVVIVETKGNENKNDSLKNPSVKKSAKDIIIIDGKEADMDAAVQKIAALKNKIAALQDDCAALQNEIIAQKIDSIKKLDPAIIQSYIPIERIAALKNEIAAQKIDSIRKLDPAVIIQSYNIPKERIAALQNEIVTQKIDSIKKLQNEIVRKMDIKDLLEKPHKGELIIIDGKEADVNRLENLDLSVIRSLTVLKDDAAINLYGEKGKNGVVIVETKGKTGSEARFFIRGITAFDDPSKNALVIIDGKETDVNILKNLDRENVHSFSILKNDDAIKRYGEKGKNGVIIVETKIGSDTTQFFIRGITAFDDDPSENVLVIIDGKETDVNILKNLDRENVHSFRILKDDDAIKRYGEKGKNGVIIVETKKSE
jgi:TonB-dependent SusC/RagA subfamily outer membrane receptor